MTQSQLSLVCTLCQEHRILISIANCQHLFCQRCLSQYAYHQIIIGYAVKCPQESCNYYMNTQSQFYKKLPQQQQVKYQYHQFWRENLNNPNVKLCPNEHCRRGIVNLKLKPPSCIHCLKQYCTQCQMQYHKGQCEKNFHKNFLYFKRCPKCKIFIERNEGCNHMVCLCGYQFCYICRYSWNSYHHGCTIDQKIPWSALIHRILVIIMIIILPLLICLLLVGYLVVMMFSGVLGMIIIPLYCLRKYLIVGVNPQVKCLMLLSLSIVGAVILSMWVVSSKVLVPLCRRWGGKLSGWIR